MTHRLLIPVSLCVLTMACNQAPAPAPATASAETGAKANEVFDKGFSGVEKEFVSLVAAMPADKFDFAPTVGAFKGVRTFGQQAKHVAGILNIVSAALLAEAAPVEGEKGPEDAKTKEQILQYVKDAFAHAHKAIAATTNANLLQETVDPFDAKAKRVRADSLVELSAHTFDHYGQMVEYARMNKVIPPASQ